MNKKSPPRIMSEKHNSFHAEKRRARRDAGKPDSNNPYPRRPDVKRENPDRYYLYGLHTVREALNNPYRKKLALYSTLNALKRLEVDVEAIFSLQGGSFEFVEKSPRDLDKMVGSDAVHQGVVLEAEPLEAKPIEALSKCNLLLLLDQVTDPHNVGAIMRSAVAMNAGALITTSRYSPVESGVLAKSASGALDLIDHIEVRNLAETLDLLKNQGFFVVGLDSEEAIQFETLPPQDRIALVLGAEGKGLRQKTRQCVDQLCKLDMPGSIKSLNVSNAAALALYISRQKLT